MIRTEEVIILAEMHVWGKNMFAVFDVLFVCALINVMSLFRRLLQSFLWAF